MNRIRRIIYTVFSILLFTSTLYAQKQKKDTLFFNFEKNYLIEFDELPNEIYPIDAGSDGSGTFYFQALDTLFNLKPKKVLCLKDFVRSSKFYNKHKTKKLDDYGLWDYLDDFQIYLVKEEKKETIYLKVYAGFVIE